MNGVGENRLARRREDESKRAQVVLEERCGRGDIERLGGEVVAGLVAELLRGVVAVQCACQAALVSAQRTSAADTAEREQERERERAHWADERRLWAEERRQAFDERCHLLAQRREWGTTHTERSSASCTSELSEASGTQRTGPKQRLQTTRERRAASPPRSVSLPSSQPHSDPPSSRLAPQAPFTRGTVSSMGAPDLAPCSVALRGVTPQCSAASTPRAGGRTQTCSFPCSDSMLSEPPGEPRQATPLREEGVPPMDLSKVRWGGSVSGEDRMMVQGALFMTDLADRNLGGWTKFYLVLSSVELAKDELRPLQLKVTYRKADLQHLLSSDKLRFVKVLPPSDLQRWEADWPWHEQRAFDSRQALHDEWGRLRPYPLTLVAVPSSSLVSVTSSIRGGACDLQEHASLVLP